MIRLFRAWLPLALLVSGAPASPASPAILPPAARAAACLVQVDGRVLMVQDVWSMRWSMPGGYIEAGELPQQAAVRETWEETGLRVEVVGTVAEAVPPQRVAIFACALSAPLVLLPQDKLALPKAARREIATARLWAAQQLPAGRWRFAAQRPVVAAWQAAHVGQSAAWLQSAAPLQDPYWRRQLAWVRALQAPIEASATAPAEARSRVAQLADQAVSRLTDAAVEEALQPPAAASEAGPGLEGEPSFSRTTTRLRARAVGLASSFGTLWVVSMATTWLWLRRGRDEAIRGVLFVTGAILLGCALKEICGLPRPCDLDPSLARGEVTGFGFPSGHSITAASVAAILWPCGGRLWRALAAAAVVACGAARLALGAHFLHDVVGGWALVGLLCVARWWAPGRSGQRRWGLRGWTAGAAAVATLTLCISPTRGSVVVAASALGFGLAAWPLRAARPVSVAWAVVGACATVVAGLLVDAGWHLAQPQEAVFVPVLAHMVGHFCCLGAVVPAVAALVGRIAPGAAPAVSPRP